MFCGSSFPLGETGQGCIGEKQVTEQQSSVKKQKVKQARCKWILSAQPPVSDEMRPIFLGRGGCCITSRFFPNILHYRWVRPFAGVIFKAVISEP